MAHTNFAFKAFLASALLLVIGAIIYAALLMPEPPLPAPAAEHQTYLSTTEAPAKPAFSPARIPPWLFVHVGVIAAFQIIALITAAGIASRDELGRRDARMVLFLCEVPMYLGLFGTLLGVCLTQFTSGSLVAPLAYITTMTGVLLHVLGKLCIWLRLPEELIQED